MRELTIEWRHYDKEGTTCDRCAATGTSVTAVVEALTEELAAKGIDVIFTETKLPAELMAESNLILLNGVPLDKVLENAAANENHCTSCSCLTGTATSCRTVIHDGKTYEEIPAELIRQAVYKATGLA